MISFLIVPQEAHLSANEADFFQKIYKLLKQDPFDIHHILVFLATSNALLCNILSEAVLLLKPLKFP